jgi:hypothetical protein
MDGAGFRYGYRLGPRVPVVPRAAVGDPTRLPSDLPTRVQLRAEAATTTDKCAGNNSNLCEKPVGQSALTLPIALGVA